MISLSSHTLIPSCTHPPMCPCSALWAKIYLKTIPMRKHTQPHFAYGQDRGERVWAICSKNENGKFVAELEKDTTSLLSITCVTPHHPQPNSYSGVMLCSATKATPSPHRASGRSRSGDPQGSTGSDIQQPWISDDKWAWSQVYILQRRQHCSRPGHSRLSPLSHDFPATCYSGILSCFWGWEKNSFQYSSPIQHRFPSPPHLGHKHNRSGHTKR